jgi:hypothetical protein
MRVVIATGSQVPGTPATSAPPPLSPAQQQLLAANADLSSRDPALAAATASATAQLQQQQTQSQQQQTPGPVSPCSDMTIVSTNNYTGDTFNVSLVPARGVAGPGSFEWWCSQQTLNVILQMGFVPPGGAETAVS